MTKTIVFFVLGILAFMGAIIGVSQSLKNRAAEVSPTPTTTLTNPVDATPTPTPTLSPTPTHPPIPTPTPRVISGAIIKTSKGDIEIGFFGQDAPNTTLNFAQKALNGFYNNLTFHRVEDWVIQGGDPAGNGTGGGTMTTELNDKPFVVGSVGVARGGDIKISNDAQFFITKKDSPFLNGQYTNFGFVVKGMEVVNQIQVGDKILGITL